MPFGLGLFGTRKPVRDPAPSVAQPAVVKPAMRKIEPIVVEGLPASILVRRSARARRMSLKVDPGIGQAVLVLPRRVSLASGLSFARAQAGWLAERLAALPERIPLADGCVLPLRGVPHLVRAVPGKRGVKIEDGVIAVGGAADITGARLLAWLKRTAKAELTGLSQGYAAQVGRGIGRIGIRDPRTRWGSCTRKGDLSYSWRLILTPPAIMAYVAAHEVAHLVHLDHSPAFWEVVERISPDFQAGRLWLRRQGPSLHRYR